ncbi:MAG TPA: lipopolysaccharide core heptose(II) kinase RfaY [Kofleriaceae bacterium]|nr:lipopolysaccharide core heptose(II) kinase RfaY [Kofleriaceae bacterium]
MLREALGVVATSVALAPALLAAQVVDAFALGIPGALAALGIAEQPRSVIALAGGRSSAVYELRFAHATVVLKHAMTGGSVLAFGARLCGPQPYPAALSPEARVRREAAALAGLARAGIVAPRVIAANPAAAVLLLEHVPGTPLSRIGGPERRDHVRAYRRALDAVHAAGWVLNDAHPGNALVDDHRIALIDLEFAERSRDPDRHACDLAYAAAFFTGDERQIFVGEPDPRIARASERLTGFAPLFSYEAARQRRAA